MAARVPASWLKGGQKSQKYSAERVEVDGITFDSKKEMRRWLDLRTLERAGAISNLQRQVRFFLTGQYAPLVSEKGRRLSYIADFVYLDGNRQIIEDAKGFATPEYKLKKAIMRAMGHEIREV